jgi:hypothetical protein
LELAEGPLQGFHYGISQIHFDAFVTQGVARGNCRKCSDSGGKIRCRGLDWKFGDAQ